MRILEDVVAALGPDYPVLIDGGFRRGSDVLKAVALGARMVLVGRPFNYAAAVGGEVGVLHAIGLLRDEVDLAIRVLSEPPPHLVARELSRMRHIACASSAYAAQHPMPQTVQDLAQVPIITSMVVGRSLRVSAYQGVQRHEVTLSPTLASENFQFLHEAILAGLGVGLVPDYVVAQDLAAGRVVQALDDWRLSIFGTRLYLLRMPDRYQTCLLYTSDAADE